MKESVGTICQAAVKAIDKVSRAVIQSNALLLKKESEEKDRINKLLQQQSEMLNSCYRVLHRGKSLEN